MMSEIFSSACINVICPNCSGKALFKSEWILSYKRKPKDKGILTCINCGLAKEYSLAGLEYYYKIQVGDRALIARSKEEFLKLREFFFEDRRINDDPDLDYPKVFYENRIKIVEKIDAFLRDEK